MLGGDDQSSDHMWAMGLYYDSELDHFLFLAVLQSMPLVMIEDWAGKSYPQCKSFTTTLKITQVHVPETTV